MRRVSRRASVNGVAGRHGGPVRRAGKAYRAGPSARNRDAVSLLPWYSCRTVASAPRHRARIARRLDQGHRGWTTERRSGAFYNSSSLCRPPSRPSSSHSSRPPNPITSCSAAGRCDSSRTSTSPPSSCRSSITWSTSSLETNRQQLAGDPRLQVFLQAWRSMFPGTVEIDVFREFPEASENEGSAPRARGKTRQGG